MSVRCVFVYGCVCVCAWGVNTPRMEPWLTFFLYKQVVCPFFSTSMITICIEPLSAHDSIEHDDQLSLLYIYISTCVYIIYIRLYMCRPHPNNEHVSKPSTHSPCSLEDVQDSPNMHNIKQYVKQPEHFLFPCIYCSQLHRSCVR